MAMPLTHLHPHMASGCCTLTLHSSEALEGPELQPGSADTSSWPTSSSALVSSLRTNLPSTSTRPALARHLTHPVGLLRHLAQPKVTPSGTSILRFLGADDDAAAVPFGAGLGLGVNHNLVRCLSSSEILPVECQRLNDHVRVERLSHKW